MIVIPAIDIQNGQCVRLYQGDFAQSTTYDADPVSVALRWQAAGASWLHIVDLDGALAGRPINVKLIEHIRDAATLHIELGGGMRAPSHIKQMLAIGIDRVVLGTAALSNRELMRDALARWGERIAVGLDARDGRVAVSGWQETSHVLATALAAELSAEGVRRFIYTDIARDGALQGPNLPALREMQSALAATTPIPSLIASGGVYSLGDLHALAALGIEGAIIGRALYTGDIILGQAIHEIEG
ncbi:MAG TPA: 1-(5-phosphoribosyl)-5-[(5-phosphoribosylamino)methylideneamino]imidazole-4-carboxamide isomerase [Ktedonobacteraceae bacterium]|nr:1-(5-phosphoribosyl)-5-[(5-phosphoribosylamino)methylideneamino]imidazole-4-carboxamide isomerase [Ktedonobacteraceae bacterium]